MSGAQFDTEQYDKYRIVLDDFIDVVDRVPFIKPSKANKGFVIPYKTLFSVLKEYSPLDTDNESSMVSNIESCFKSEDNEKIENSRNRLIQYLRNENTKKRLYQVLSKSIENYDDCFTRILDFFSNSCEKIVSKKRKASQSSQSSQPLNNIAVNSNTMSLVYTQFLKTNPFDTRTTLCSSIQTKIRLKSSQWTQIKKFVDEPRDVVIMLSSIFYDDDLNPSAHQDNTVKHTPFIDPRELLGISDNQLEILKLFFMIQLSGNLCVLNDRNIIQFLSEALKLRAISTTCSLDSFIRRYFKKIVNFNDKKKVFPLNDNEFTLRHISQIIRKSTKAKKILRKIGALQSLQSLHCSPGSLYDIFTVEMLKRLPSCEFVDTLSNIHKTVVKKYLGMRVGFNQFLPSQTQYFAFAKYKNIDLEFIKHIEILYHVNIVIFDEKKNTFISTNNCITSGYTLFAVANSLKGFRILKYNNNALIKCGNWKEWIESQTEWKPAFSEIWDYFKKTGQHVPPIKEMKQKKGLTVFGVPFVTANYKTYISHTTKDSKSFVKCNGFYCMQYEDAFKFVKRQNSKRHQLHYKSKYELMTIRDLLYFFPLNQIHKLILENASHGIFVEHVSPIFERFSEFDNAIMLKWWTVSNRFYDKVRGYFTEFGSLYFEEVYDTSIDPISESCVGFQWDKIKILNINNVHTHSLSPQDVVLILASIYIEQYSENCDNFNILDVEIPVYTNILHDKDSFHDYFKTSHLNGVKLFKGLEVKDEILYEFILNYFIMYGPFAIFNNCILDEELTEYIFNLQIYYNEIKNIDADISECVSNIVNMFKDKTSETHLSIPNDIWKAYIRGLPNTEKYNQLKNIPNVPCLVYLKNGKKGIIQSFNVINDKWRIVTYDNESVNYQLLREQFDIIENDRVLPAKCILHPLSIEQNIPNFRLYIGTRSECEGTVVKKLDDVHYLVKVDELMHPIKLKRDSHFTWKTSVMMELTDVRTAEIGNTDMSKKYTEDRTYDKGFSNRGSKMRSRAYHPLRKDAHLPSTEDVKLPEYIKEDEMLNKLLDKDDLNSIFPFIDYTAVNITADELYGTYGKIMDRCGEKSVQYSYEDILLLVIDDLWKDMSTDRLRFNVVGIMNKLGGNVIDMKKEIVKNVYNL